MNGLNKSLYGQRLVKKSGKNFYVEGFFLKKLIFSENVVDRKSLSLKFDGVFKLIDLCFLVMVFVPTYWCIANYSIFISKQRVKVSDLIEFCAISGYPHPWHLLNNLIFNLMCNICMKFFFPCDGITTDNL